MQNLHQDPFKTSPPFFSSRAFAISLRQRGTTEKRQQGELLSSLGHAPPRRAAPRWSKAIDCVSCEALRRAARSRVPFDQHEVFLGVLRKRAPDLFAGLREVSSSQPTSALPDSSLGNASAGREPTAALLSFASCFKSVNI